MLVAIVADIDRAQTPSEQAEKSKGRGVLGSVNSQAAQHGAQRLISGFSIIDTVSEFRALRASVMHLWNEQNPAKPPGANDEFLRFNEAVDQSLAESVARYSADQKQHVYLLDMLLSSSPDLNFLLKPDGEVIYANKAMADLYRKTPGEILGKKVSELSVSGADRFQQLIKQVGESKTMYRGEIACERNPDSGNKYEHLLVPVINAQGRVDAIAGMARDMTERNRLLAEVQREKSISDTIIECTSGSFFMIDQQNHLVRWNHDLNQQSGLTDAQLKGSSILNYIHDDDRALAAAKFLAAFATGFARMEVRVYTRDMGVRYFLKNAKRFMVDGVPFVAGFCVDVTDRKISEQALAVEKKFSDALIESVPGAFFVIDTEGNFFRWNNYLNNLTGLSNSQLMQRPMLLSISEEDRPLAAATMKDAFENGYAQAELHVLTHELGIRLFVITARRFLVGTATYLVGVGTDATDRLANLKNLEHEAWTDPLTKIANRGHFMQMAKLEFSRCRRYGHALSIWMLDIDHFKGVNDTFGHQAGDLALQSVVKTSQKELRDWDILGRLGGEEFAVLLPETETDKALLVAERLRQLVAGTCVPLGEGLSVSMTVSIGIATVQANDSDIEALMGRADEALYRAKRTGRDKVCLAESPP